MNSFFQNPVIPTIGLFVFVIRIGAAQLLLNAQLGRVVLFLLLRRRRQRIEKFPCRGIILRLFRAEYFIQPPQRIENILVFFVLFLFCIVFRCGGGFRMLLYLCGLRGRFLLRRLFFFLRRIGAILRRVCA